MTSGFEDVAVIMITKNEERAIGKVIDDVKKSLPGCEVFVIDGSTDKTPELAKAAGATVLAEPGGGFGPAFLFALSAPKQPLIATLDADDTYPTDVFPFLVSRARLGVDVVGTDRLGSRPVKNMPLANWFANKLFCAIASIRAGKVLKDVHSGQRVYHRSVIHQFDWDSKGLAFPVDLLLWPALANLKIEEYKINYKERIGESTLSRWPSTKASFRRLFRRRIILR